MATTTMEDMIPASHCMHRDSFQIVHVPQEEIAVESLTRSEEKKRQRTAAVANNTTQHQQQLYDREEETLVLRECYRRCYQRSMEAAVAPTNPISVVVGEGTEEKEAPTPATTNLNSVAWDTQKRALLPEATSLDKPSYASEALFRASANTSCTCETIDTEVSQQSRDICCDQKDAACGAASATSNQRQDLDVIGSLLVDSSSHTNGPLAVSNDSTSTDPMEEDTGDQEEEDLATSTSKTRQDLGHESSLADNSSYGPFNGSTSTNPPSEEDATSCDQEEEEDTSKNRQDLGMGGDGNSISTESSSRANGPLDATANDATSTSSNPTPPEEEGPQPTTSHQELVLITGSSGMGKTALATSLRDEVLSDGGFFVSGKCGDQQQQQPFVAALTEWVRQAELREPFLKRHLRARVRQDKDLAAGIGTLLEEVPSLASIVGGGAASATSKDNTPGDNNTQACRKGQAQTLFAMVFRRFLRIVCSLGRPMVLLIDDLQWANQPSLDLLESLLLSSLEGLLIMGTCRDGEVSVQDPLAQMLRRVEEKGCLIVEVSPPNLGLPALAMMVQAQATHLSVSECTALAHTVLQETKGNALFAQQYIRSLHNNDLVVASDDASSCRSSIATSETSFDDSSNSTGGGIQDDRIVRWLVRQMKRLPHDAQYLLQAISCLGGIFTRELLQRTTQLSPAALRDFLDVALHQNLVVYNQDTQAGRFAHDKYQESAYSLLISNPKERALFHLRLGRNLLQSCSDIEQDQDQYLGSIVDLLLVGKEYLTNEEERENLALWCLAVGRKVALKSSFAGPWAIGYIEQGIELLGLRHWRDQYNLSMALYNAAAELAYCQGNHARVGELVGAIKCNARCFMDQVQAHITSMYSLGARGERAMALELGFCVLDQLGYPFPRKLSWFAIQRDLRKTQKMLQKFTEQQIMNLPAAVNRQALIAMTVMQMLHPIYSALRPEYTALTGSRLVQITLECGSTPVSALGFAFYSLSLVRVWRFEDARKYGELALKLDDDKFACREWRSKLFLTLATGPAFLGRSLQYAYDLMKKSHLSGLETGDMETGLRATMCLVLGQTFFGNNLADTLQSTKDYTRLCNEYASTVPTLLFGPCSRVCRMLMGSEPVDAELPNRLCAEIKNEAILTYVLITYSFAATYANDLVLGGRLMKEVRKRKGTASQLIPFCQMSQIFCEGIIAAALGRKDKSNIKVARRRLAKLKELAKYNPQLFSNKVRLLDAEIRACSVVAKSREFPQVMSLYDNAIRSSEEHGFVHEAALVCEKAGALLLRCHRAREAETYLKKSRVLYLNWGARLKVKQIDEIILSVQQ